MTAPWTVPATVGEAVSAAARRLAACGVDGARLDARLLAARALDVGPEAVIGHPERRLSRDERRRFAQLVERRARREPLAKVVGVREFWSLPFKVTAETLDPRPDSESLVEAALAFFAAAPPRRVLDLGTGTGCLLLALLSEWPGATGVGVDISAAALAAAAGNAAALGLSGRASFCRASWGRGIEELFDCIVCNPPYIPNGEILDLAPEVSRFEPSIALSGGEDGLASYRDLAPEIARLLARDGAAFIEVGAGQGSAVAEILARRGLAVCDRVCDLAGRERCLIATHGDITTR